MKYFAHFFIGKEFSDLVEKTGKLLLKYGNNDVVSTVNLFLVNNENNAAISIRKLLVSSIATNELLAGFDKNIEVSWEEENSLEVSDQKAFSEFYTRNIFDKILTINNRGNFSALYVFMHFPTYKRNVLNTVKLFYNAIEQSGKPTVIDFMGYVDDFADIIEPCLKITTPSHDLIADFEKFRQEKKMPFNRHFVAMQNASHNGITLNLNSDSLSEVIGRFALLCSDYYDEIFPGIVDYKDVVSFGLSALCLDKYLFAEYLFNKTILNAIDNSEVNRSDVDVNIACDTANLLLKNKMSVLSEHFRQFPRENSKDTDNFPKIQQEFEKEINQIIEKCREIFTNNQSITVKAAILAAVLAKTEYELFSKSIFNQDAATFDDLFSEPFDYFVEYNDKIEFYKIDDEPIVNPVRELKETNTKLINSESEIRDLKEQLSSLEKQISDAQKVENCYIEDGFFHFQDTKFRLLPNIKEEPLEDSYEAHPIAAKSVDLRQNFNAIRNQGQLGSCLAFSITSIFEYILKVNQSRESKKNISMEIDLSESFLYYNARDMDSTGDISVNTDSGSRFLPAMQSLQKFGIALERFCSYNEHSYDKKPSEEAYLDASGRRLIKALNVNRKTEDIKSALADGYPVAVSLNLCKSFTSTTNGFISLPSDEEIAELLSEDDANKDKHSRHAMVITGFSEELQMFVLRNSWGTEWGENGYCYVPYAYVENEQLCNFSCIITEVETLTIAKMEDVPSLKVDDTDLNIRYFITKASLQKESLEFENNRKRRDYLRLYFEKLKKVLSSPNDRDIYITQSKEKLGEEIDEIKKARKVKEDEQEEELKKFSQIKRHTIIRTIAYILEFAFLFYLLNSLINNFNCILSNSCSPNWWLIVSAIIIIIGIIYFRKILPKTALISIGVVLLIFGISSVVTFIRCDDNCDYSVSYLWLIPVYLVLAGIVIYNASKLWKEWRDKRDEMEEEIRKMNKEIAGKESEINNFKIKTFAAWTLLKSLEKAQNHFQLLYGNFISLINNLRTWYSEVADTKNKIELSLTTPNASLLGNEVLNRFFETKLKHDDRLKIDLTAGIENHEITGEYLKTYKVDLFDKIAQILLTCRELSDFNISEHITENKYSGIAIEVTRNLIDEIDSKSDLFLEVSSNERGEIIRSTGIYVPSTNVYKDKLRRN